MVSGVGAAVYWVPSTALKDKTGLGYGDILPEDGDWGGDGMCVFSVNEGPATRGVSTREAV